MKITATALPGVLIIEPKLFGDARGFFLETFQTQRYAEAGITQAFVQDNHSRSQKNVLRGLHFQRARPQGKLVSVSRGAILDITLDINPQSATFGQHIAVELNDETHQQVWIPPGYAHGFCVLSDSADMHYKCTQLYDPEDEAGVIWNDPDLHIAWPTQTPLLSNKDQHLPRLRDLS